jgi:hypothetical protein
MKNTFLVIVGLFVILAIYLWKRRDLSLEPFFQEIYLTDSEMPLEKNPEYLLPSNNTSTVPQSGGSKEGVDLYKNDKIHSYVKGDGKISFKRSEIANVFSDQLSKFPREENESEESYLSRFMVPILWQTTKNQFDSFFQLSSSIEQIKTDLRSANIKMVSINNEVEKIGDDDIAKKRSEDFDFKSFE